MTIQNSDVEPPVEAEAGSEAGSEAEAEYAVEPAPWPVSRVPPTGSDADLWLVRMPAAWLASIPLHDSVLDGTERRRAASFVHAADRARYAAAHIAVRKLLGAYLGVHPRSVRYRRDPCPCCGGPHGRPTLLTSSPPYFSLSHAGDLMLVGVAGAPVGVDIERCPTAHTVASVSGVLHPYERDEIVTAAPERRAAVFTRLWTRKEAYLKGLGSGLGRAPGLDCTSGGTGAPAPPDGWHITDLPVGTAHAAAAVRGTSPGRVMLRELSVHGVLAPFAVSPGHAAPVRR